MGQGRVIVELTVGTNGSERGQWGFGVLFLQLLPLILHCNAMMGLARQHLTSCEVYVGHHGRRDKGLELCHTTRDSHKQET